MKRLIAVDISSLEDHKKFYENQKAEYDEKRSLKLAESRILPEMNAYKSRFYTRIITQDQLAKEEREAKINRAREIMLKHK